MSKSSSACWLVLVLFAGCEGTLSSSPRTSDEDGGIVPTVDGGGGGARDGGVGPGTDASVDDGAVILPTDGGTATDGGPTDPCATVTCPTNARCVATTGACACNPGYTDVGGACMAIPPGDPAGRTEAEVCTAWRDGHVENARPAWTAGSSMCELGTLASAAIDDTIRRIDMFRWLLGLGPVANDPAQQPAEQACAVMMNAEGALNHMPGPSYACYTTDGAGAAGRSNLALGTSSPGGAIDLYMSDNGVPSLGHRRWVINFRLGRVGIGFAGRAQCLAVFDTSGSSDRTWTAYPNPGPTPIETTTPTFWSFHMSGAGAAGVTVERVSDGAMLDISVMVPPAGYGPDTVAWSRSGWSPAAGESYRVTITGVAGAPIVYVVQPVGC